MTRYQEVSQNKIQFLSMSGYTVPEFESLLPYFAAQFEAYVEQYTLEGKERKNRRHSAYRNSPLPTIEDKLYFILVYLKLYTLQSAMGELFGMHQPEVNLWVHLLLPLLKQALADCGELPARTMAELNLPDQAASVFFHDGTERPIQRPSDPEKQDLYYSGKKKSHTVKNDLIGNEEARIIFLTDTMEGKKHDKKIADEANYSLPSGSVLFQDTGFQGFSLKHVAILQPKKKPKGKDLAPFEKALNQFLSSIRIRIEHIIKGVKRYRIVKDKFRNWKTGLLDLAMVVCCALHNFRLRFRPWQYDPIPSLQFMIKSL